MPVCVRRKKGNASRRNWSDGSLVLSNHTQTHTHTHMEKEEEEKEMRRREGSYPFLNCVHLCECGRFLGI
jgi:hypothetical protein